MATTILRGTTSNKIRFLLDVTGLDDSSAGLIISTICDNEATAVTYTQAAGNIETISTLGTYSAPSANKCRFKEVDATNHPGLYEFQFADARFNVSNSARLVISCSGAGLPATGIHYEVDVLGETDLRKIRNSLVAASNLETFVNIWNAQGGVSVYDIQTDAITASSIENNAFTSAKFASGAFDNVWAVASRTLTAFGFSVTVGTNNDKTGYSLTAGTGLGNQTANITGDLSGSVGSVTGAVTVGTNNDKTGYSLTAGTGLGNQTANITGDLSGSVGSVTGSVGSVTGSVTVGTNNDKTGYSLTQAFPANFSALGIKGSGAIESVDTVQNVADKTGYSLTQAFPANFSALEINSSGHVSRVTLVDTTTTNTDMRGTDNALLAANYTTPPTPNQIMGGLVTGSQPNGSLARFVRNIKNNDVLFEGQIVSASTDTAILDAGATTVCVGQAISIGEEGDAERQTRFVTAFNPSTKEITTDRPWCVVPPNGSDYQIKTHRNPLVGRTSTALANGYGEAIAESYTILDTLTEDSGGLRYTAKALEEAPTGGGGGSPIIIQPIAGVTPRRVEGAKIFTYNGENYTAVVSGIDDQGNIIDWTTLPPLEFVVELDTRVDLIVIDNANITRTSTSFSVVIPASVNVVPEGRAFSIPYKWSIRESNSLSKVVIMEGQLVVTRTALKD